mmetsp:Transcript_20982/g.43051  ORF Transcript_20982/g.43051 Transcript_20982/m.43051 type:complete len:390 (+) Transcript_20982:366-1535(+)
MKRRSNKSNNNYSNDTSASSRTDKLWSIMTRKSPSSSCSLATSSIPMAMLLLSSSSHTPSASAFSSSSAPSTSLSSLSSLRSQHFSLRRKSPPLSPPTSTSLPMVWWFGGTPTSPTETSTSGEECELVAVRIDRTSANSRRIAGEITVNCSAMEVWAILTDYDRLSGHVPNLVASRRVDLDGRGGKWNLDGSAPGDGRYECRLYQRGAQKIVGFEFGADVTMDMTEKIVFPRAKEDNKGEGHHGQSSSLPSPREPERHIQFRCVDSQFFSQFDGTWKVVPLPPNPFTGEPETMVSYTVDVRPKGPVPVAALEWRIREDVPTNLRAVKRAAVERGWAVLKRRGLMLPEEWGSEEYRKKREEEEKGGGVMGGFADFILDYENETLGAYLEY